MTSLVSESQNPDEIMIKDKIDHSEFFSADALVPEFPPAFE